MKKWVLLIVYILIASISEGQELKDERKIISDYREKIIGQWLSNGHPSAYKMDGIEADTSGAYKLPFLYGDEITFYKDGTFKTNRSQKTRHYGFKDITYHKNSYDIIILLDGYEYYSAIIDDVLFLGRYYDTYGWNQGLLKK